MEILEQRELSSINGGSKGWAAFIIGQALVFIFGFIEGIINPNKCNC